jgi:hypothetical protein
MEFSHAHDTTNFRAPVVVVQSEFVSPVTSSADVTLVLGIDVCTTAASIFDSNNLIVAVQNEEILWNTIQAAAEEDKELAWQMTGGRVCLELLTV